FYVHEDTPIEHLFNLFQDEGKNITAVGVVDNGLYGKGTIVRKELASLLSKPFGREVLRKRPVRKVVTPAKSFLNTQHIFIVSDELDEEVKSVEEHNFLLVDKTGRFSGIFSTQDLLIYLSNLTQNDITLAHSLQTRMVKERLAVLTADLEIVGSSHTAKGVGGDFYSAKKISNTKWVLSLCDVSG
ncbi:MAG: SpoIIE family protein phosphatase, partial [Sediminispirochaetaceae bacterium]